MRYKVHGISVSFEQEMNLLKVLLIKRGCKSARWGTYTHLSQIILEWCIETPNRHRHSFQLNDGCDTSAITSVKYWIEQELGIPLETEAEKMDRILNSYD